SAIDFFLTHSDYDSLFTVTRQLKRYYDLEGNPINHDMYKLLNTQVVKPLFEENSNIYLFTRKSFGLRKSRIGMNPCMFEITKGEALDIDDEFDFELVDKLIYTEL
ncbi:MAG: acylneuraminate cytidylyltransferase family protein, partial [Thermotogota bacterium]|nr:acylneuraminate cytidylyltransferase family protein [Thermotogota bacterium]